MKTWIIMALVFSFSLTSHAYTNTQPVLKDQAMTYIIRYSGSTTNAGKEKALNQFDMLIRQHPDDIALRQLYSDLLIVDTRYDKAITQLSIINQDTQVPSLKLMECMLTERIHLPHIVCYRDVISLFEKNNITDFNYFLALHLGGTSDFSANKKDWLETHTLTDEQKEVIALEPRMLVNTYYP